MGKEKVVVGSIVDIVNGKNQRKVENPDGKYPIYGSGGIIGYADDYICEANTVVIGRKGSINNPIYVEEPFWNVDTAFGLVAHRDTLLPRYLYYFCKYFDFEKLNTTVTIPSLTKTNIAKIQMSVPELAKQEAIVQKLDKISLLIALRNQQLTALDTLIKARFVEMFGDPITNPMGLRVVQFGTVLTVEPQNGLYKPQSDYVTDGTGTPILRIDGFYNGKVTDFSALKRLHCTEMDMERYRLAENDIVINRVNSLEYLGKCGLICGMNEETVFESNMMRLHVDETVLNPVFITHLLCTEFIYLQILNRAKKAVNQASINQKDVQSFIVFVPPMELQNHFAALVQQVEKSKSAIQQGLQEMELLKNSLMQEYFG